MKRISTWIYSIVSFSFLVISCDKSELVTRDKVIINNNSSSLSQRINHKNAGLLNFQTPSNNGMRFRSGESQEAIMLTSSDKNFALALVSEVSAPEFEGQQLRSTHVAVDGSYAYVSYNTEGDRYLGGIDIIDIADINNPRLVISAKLPDIDVNALYVDGNKLLIAGAADRDVFSDLSSSAFSSYLPLNNGLIGSNFDFKTLQGPTALDIIAGKQGANFVVSGGMSGVLAKLNKQNGNVEMSITIPDLRSVRDNGVKVVALSGTGLLKVYNGSLVHEKDIVVQSNTAEAKRTMDLYQNIAIVPQGRNGFATYNIQSGSLIKQHEIPNYTGNDSNLDPEDVVVNAVSVNNDKLFAANGGAGVSIYGFNNQSGVADLLGTASFNGLDLTSSNFVVSRENYVFVASGRGGLKILKMIDLTPKVPTCNGNYPTYTGNDSWFNINSNEVRNFSGVRSFQGINVGGTLTWCGTLSVTASDLNVNSNGNFNVYGTLAASKNLNVNANTNLNGASVVEGNIHLNSNGLLRVFGNLSQGKSTGNTTFHVNGKLEIDGEVVVYGDLNINSSGTVEFKNAQSKLIVYGKYTNNNGKVLNGSIQKI
jgi:cytoskeletal protein CcmA (bactofilin family)